MAWISPTRGSGWTYPERAYDNSLDTYAYTHVPGKSWGAFLELTHAGIVCNKVQFYAFNQSPFGIVQIDVDVYYEGGWHDVYQGDFANMTWVEKNIPAGTKLVTKARISSYNNATVSARADFYEFDFWEIPIVAPTVTTKAATNVQATTARLNGQISNDGGAVCQYRFRYKKSGGAYSYTTWTGAKTTGQTFYENISSLDKKSLYYFNAQAKNSAGESAWGNQLSFTTLATIPVVTTQAVSDIGLD